MKKILLPILTLLIFCSCGKKVILDDSRTFSGNTWLRFQPEKFQVEAPNTDDCYNFVLTLNIDTTRYHENGLPIMLEIANPEGETRTLFHTIVLRNYEGNWLGEFDDQGMLQISQVIRQYYFFNVTGIHTLNLSQRTSKYEIHGINQINLRIEKVKLEYPDE